MQTQLKIEGVKSYKGTIDGVDHDFTKVIITLPFPKSREETQIGNDAQAVNYGDSRNFQQFIRFKGKFPLIVNAEIDLVKKGSETAIEIASIDLPKAG